MKKTDFSVSLRDGVRKRLKQYSRLLSQSLSASFLLLMLTWHNQATGQNCSLTCHGAQVSLGIDCTAEITVESIGDTSACTTGDFDVFVIELDGDTVPFATVTEVHIGTTLIASLYDNNSGNSCWSYITVADKLPPSLECDCTPVGEVSGAITNTDPSFDNGVACWIFPDMNVLPPSGIHYYDEWHFQIAEAGMYTFTYTGNIGDAMGAIYENDFIPATPCVNLLGGDDDSGSGLDPVLTIHLMLVPGDYILVTTTFGIAETGLYNWAISGPGDVFDFGEDCFYSCGEISPLAPLPLVVDNCTDNASPILINETIEVLCDPIFTKRLTREWIAVDGFGNATDTCTQVFYLERIDFSEIVWPDTFSVSEGNAFECDGNFTDNDGDGIPDAIPVSEGGAGVPTIDGIAVFPDFIFYCNASIWYEDVPIHNHSDCVQKVMRIWTASEWHCTGEVDTLYAQLIEVVDDEGPVLTCPPGFSHTTTGHTCTASIWIPAATAFDECSDIVTYTVAYPGGFRSQNGLFYATLPVGNNIITYTAYDGCFNSSQCTMTIVVADGTPPIPVCDEHTVVSLTIGGYDGLTKVDASVFDDGSYDACGPVTFMARRMDSCIDFDWTTEGAGIDETPDNDVDSRDHGTVHRPKVPFACCDATGEPIMIELRVTDASGNHNYCMVEVIVQDKIRPIIECPEDITISCEYPLNIDDLDEFGTVVRDQHDVQTWCIYDPTNDYANADGFICRQDGIATDNCQVDISVTAESFLNNCGMGYIVRTWTASDANGSDVCYQYIYVENFEPIDSNAIIWPEDFHGLECALGTDPEDLPYPYSEPQIDEDECDLVGVTYEDLVFPIVDGACYKILRTWKVIEWCLYDQYDGLVPGINYWEHVQVLKVTNAFGPDFLTDQPTIERCNDFDCGGLFVELIQRAEDDCTPDNLLQNGYAIDYNNDLTIDAGPFPGLGAVIDASDVYPLGTHRIIYTFEDRCGNRSVREQLLILNSCKAPVPVCINGLSTDLMPVDTDGDGIEDTGMITIWAQDFDASSYHPCGSPFVFSLDEDISITSLTFTCEDVGAPVPVNLYVTDHLGNQAYCETYIIIQDNMGICPENGNLIGTITGNVSTETSDNVLNVEVSLVGSPVLPINTNQTGSFTFPAMPAGNTYNVAPAKDNDWSNGVSTLDLVHIQKHLLGHTQLSSPYKMIAADANNSQSITAIDLVEIRKLILGIYTELPHNTSWRFVDKSYSFPDPFNPWMQQWPESHMIDPLATGINHANFFGIKIGDVNNTVKANFNSIVPRGSGVVFDLAIDDRAINAGEVIEVPVYANEDGAIEGIQFSFDMAAGLELAGIQAGLLDVTADNFGWLQNRILTASWNSVAGVTVNTQQPLFTLVLKAASATTLGKAIAITAAPTQPEAYNVNSEIMDVKLSFRGLTADYTFELMQNEPNPFTGSTQIGFVLPSNGAAKLTLFDVTGRELYTQAVDGVKGMNKVELHKGQLNGEGIVYYQLQFEGYTATKKMLIL
jgi:hypothetical protein